MGKIGNSIAMATYTTGDYIKYHMVIMIVSLSLALRSGSDPNVLPLQLNFSSHYLIQYIFYVIYSFSLLSYRLIYYGRLSCISILEDIC